MRVVVGCVRDVRGREIMLSRCRHRLWPLSQPLVISWPSDRRCKIATAAAGRQNEAGVEGDRLYITNHCDPRHWIWPRSSE